MRSARQLLRGSPFALTRSPPPSTPPSCCKVAAGTLDPRASWWRRCHLAVGPAHCRLPAPGALRSRSLPSSHPILGPRGALSGTLVAGDRECVPFRVCLRRQRAGWGGVLAPRARQAHRGPSLLTGLLRGASLARCSRWRKPPAGPSSRGRGSLQVPVPGDRGGMVSRTHALHTRPDSLEGP